LSFQNNSLDDLLKEAYKIQATKSTKISNEFIDKLKFAFKWQEKLKQNSKESDLSSRELDILKQLSLDLTNKEIADELFISVHTVKTHMKNILMKLEVDKRSKAVVKAQEMGII